MAEIGHLRAALSASTASFESDMKRARDAVRTNAKGMETALDSVGKKFAQAGTAINRYAGVAAVAAAGAFVAFVKQQIDVADKMGKLAQQTGTTSEYLSSMSLVASQSGTTLESVAKSTQKLSKNMLDARAGTGDAKDAFADLGIGVTETNGTLRNSEAVMKDIATKFAGMSDGADKTALAMKIFGKSGAELIPMLNMGAAGIEQLQRKAEEMGLVISTKTALEAAYLNDQLDLLKNSAIGAGRGMALSLIPWLNESIAVIKLAKEESGTLMAAWVALGAVGSALFTKSVTQQINQAREAVAELEKSVAKLSKNPDRADYKFEVKRLDEWRKKLATLEAQKQRDIDLEEKAMKASLAAGEARRKATEEMVKESEARINAGLLSKKAEEAERARIKAAKDAIAAIDQQVAALQFQAETYGKTSAEIAMYRLELAGANAQQMEAARLALVDVAAKEAQADAAKEAREAIDEMAARGEQVYIRTHTAAEQYNATLIELNMLLERGAISQDVYGRAAAQAMDQAEAGAQAVLELLKSEETLLAESYQRRKQIILDSVRLTGDEKNQIIIELEKARIAEIEEMNHKHSGAMAAASGAMFGNMADLAKEFAGEQSGIYKGLFAVSKAFALAEAILNLNLAIAKAASAAPWPANLGAMASVAASVGGVVSAIASTNFGGGRAIGGPVSAGKMYEVNERGPEILNMGSRQFLMMGNQSGSVIPNHDIAQGSPDVNLRVINVVDPKMVEQWAASPAGERVIMNVITRNKGLLQ